MPSTPLEWLDYLAVRLDRRFPRIAANRAYATGHAPLPEMGENLRASWEMFQRKAIVDYGGLAIRSLANRIVPNRITVGDSGDEGAAEAARRIWRDNRLDVVVADAINDYLATSVGYLVVGSDPEDGSAVITRERPETFIAATDPARPWRVRAALKAWRDEVAEKDYAYVWAPGEGQLFERPSRATTGALIDRVGSGGWVQSGDSEPYDGRPPVIVLDREVGFIESHHGLIDRINHNKLNRLVITAMQAFRQRGIKIPENVRIDDDDDENAVDLAKMFEPAPGALWELPDGIDVWESQETAIDPLLNGEKQDAKDFAAVTQTPISVLMPEGENQSAEGAENATAGQVFQANAEITRIAPSLGVMLVYALRVESVDVGDQTIEVGFMPADRVSVSEKYAAATAAKAAGESWQSIARNVLGYSQEQIEQDARDRATEQLQALTLISATGGGNSGNAVA